MMLLSVVDSGFDIPIWTLVPFVLMLLMIAIGPLFFEHWWEKNKNKLIVSLILGVPTAIYLIYNGLSHDLMHQIVFDYVPFISLLGALFVITGGIQLQGDIKALPKINTLFMIIGAILASIMGTTGAAMLLIRPLIKTNSQRKHKVHTILFFIAIVANCGGLLTPLGDPPLFLLYLRGASFSWFFTLFPQWMFVNTVLILLYFIVDTYFHKKEDKADLELDNTQVEKIKIKGKLNFLWLIGVVLSVAFINNQYFKSLGDYIILVQVAVLLLLCGASMVLTSKKLREDNKFTWTPIVEVAYLFLGIFATMVPALLYLKLHAGNFGLSEPIDFYYATGVLSSFLDNAPTAVAFHGVASGLGITDVSLVAGIPEVLLSAISLGAVLFGAMTYIGNGPNFMIKAIAEENKINMPSFFGYMIKFSLIVLLPVYVLTQLLFL